MYSKSLLALAASISAAQAAIKGFNYGSTNTDGSAVTQARFTELFNTAKNLAGTSGFTSARLYTTVQAGTANGPISAIPAAIDTQTTLLLGLWASAGQTNFNNELAALSSAISTYGTAFTSLIEAISIGSEDLYRYGSTGVMNQAGVGVGPDVIVNYIGQVRALIAGTAASGAKITHVDTFNSWTNGSNSAVVDAVDFLSMDAYPYFQPTDNNIIGNSNVTFYDALDATIGASKGKPVWVTETGWPIAGPTVGQGVPSVANAEFYWKNTGCSLFKNTNTYWYTLQDTYPTAPETNFGIVGATLSTTPLFDLTCPVASVSSSSSSVASSFAPASSSVAPSVAPVPVTTSSAAPAPVTTSSVAPSVVSSSASVASSSKSSSSGSAVASSSVAPVASSSAKPVSSSASAVASSSAAPVASSSVAPVVSASVKPVSSSASESDVTITKTSTTYSTVSACAASSGVTVTVQSTTYVTVSGCSGSCSSTVVVPSAIASSSAASSAPASSVVSKASSSAAVSSAAASSSAAFTPASSSAVSSKASSTSASASATATVCPANLSGEYQYPHLIVPVNSSSPNTAYGTQYFATISPSVSTIFNFDIPASYAGKTCTLIMLFPEKKDLETSDYTYSKTGGISFDELKAPATADTTYANAPASAIHLSTIDQLTPGNSYVVTSHACGAGERIAFEASSVGGLDLTYFEDWNPSPLGLFISVC